MIISWCDDVDDSSQQRRCTRIGVGETLVMLKEAVIEPGFQQCQTLGGARRGIELVQASFVGEGDESI